MENIKCIIHEFKSDYKFKDKKDLENFAKTFIVMSNITDEIDVLDACITNYKDEKVIVIKIKID